MMAKGFLDRSRGLYKRSATADSEDGALKDVSIDEFNGNGHKSDGDSEIYFLAEYESDE